VAGKWTYFVFHESFGWKNTGIFNRIGKLHHILEMWKTGGASPVRLWNTYLVSKASWDLIILMNNGKAAFYLYTLTYTSSNDLLKKHS